MPLLFFTSLLTLLLLPLSLSCKSKRLSQDIRSDYYIIVRTHLNNTRESVTTALQNSTCPELRHKSRNCTSRNADIVNTLHLLACKMKHFGLSLTERLTTSVLNSIRCFCPEKPTRESAPELKKTTTASRQRRTEQRRSQREARKLYKIKAHLAAMTECYEMLNAQESADRPGT